MACGTKDFAGTSGEKKEKVIWPNYSRPGLLFVTEG